MPNVFKEARLQAAKTDERFKTVSSASEMFPTISRQNLLMIEQEDPHKHHIDPTPYDVKEMAKVYNAPELCDYFCANLCCLGEGREQLIYGNLGNISAKLMSALHFLQNANDGIHHILADSKITDDEKATFQKIIKTLKDISYSAESLELWAKKNGFID